MYKRADASSLLLFRILLSKVLVGSAEPPMPPEHYIERAEIGTKFGSQRYMLKPVDKPETYFVLAEGGGPADAYACCHLHRLWKS